MIKRIIADAVLFLSIFFLPWYLTAALGIIFIFLFSKFWEAAGAGFFIDALYLEGFGIFTICALLLVFFLNAIKEKVRLF